MAQISCTLNGAPALFETDAERTLLEVLREDAGLTGTKYGCGEGTCRSCTVLVGGRPAMACQTPMSRVEGKDIITIEGLAPDGGLMRMQEAFIAEDAMQCGFCVPGMILTAEALLRSNPTPTRDEINTFMNGNLCRCCNYLNIVRAIERCAGTIAETGA